MYMEIITFKYLSDFKCDGQHCPDLCCVGWVVYFSQENYQRMAAEMMRSSEEKEELLNKVNISQKEDGQKVYCLKMGAGSRCLFLREDRLCSLQARFGEKAQPKICIGFPRIVSVIGQRMEISSTLACPLTARRCLLDPDAMRIVNIPDGALSPFVEPNFVIDLQNSLPYRGHFDLIRAEMFVLCGLKEFTAATRIFFICYFAHRIGAFFNLSTTNDVTELLNKEIAFINNADVRQELHSHYSEITLSEKTCLTLIEQLLNAVFLHPVTAEFKQLLFKSLKGFGAVIVDGSASAEINDIIRNYHQVKQQWNSEFGKEIDQFTMNYFMNNIFSSPYIKDQNLLLYIRNVIIASVIFRLLLFGILENDKELVGKTREERKEYLENIAVAVVQIFSKSINHNLILVKSIQQELDRHAVNTLAQMLSLIQF